ncbi:MAG: DMT family transporter [Lachnospiraceae bacterium]|nr:DMT family transporter [Lachnospiraceae bacterium]
MSEKNAALLLSGVIIARSTSFLFSKLSLQGMTPFTLLGWRFCIAFAVLLILFFPRLKKARFSTVWKGALLGFLFFMIVRMELCALRTADTGTVSFLENTAILWVPLFQCALKHRRPEKHVAAGVILLLGGVLLITAGKSGLSGLQDLIGLSGLHYDGGLVFALAASFLYATAILLTKCFSNAEDPLLLGIFQVGTMGVLGAAGAVLFEVPRLPQGGREWAMILMLALICSCFGFTLQPVAQRHVSSEKAGMFCALNPLSASILGFIFLHESIRPVSLMGFALILAGLTTGNSSASSFRPASLWTRGGTARRRPGKSGAARPSLRRRPSAL